MKVIITLIATALTFQVLAQEDYSKMSFPPPDVAPLLRYIEKPVSLYNGQVAINIPLYTMKDGTDEIPISISYTSPEFLVK
jgi:hypothetical protein